MPHRFSPLPIKMTDKSDGGTCVHRTRETLPLNLSATEKSGSTTPTDEHGTASPKLDANQGQAKSLPKRECEKAMPCSDGAAIGSFKRGGDAADGPRAGRGKSPQHRVATRSKPASKKKSDSPSNGGRSRYDVSVGPLTNAPAVKSELRNHLNDRRVPSPGMVRQSDSSGYNLVPVVPSGAAIRPVEPTQSRAYPVEPQSRLSHHLPAMVTCPRPQRTAEGNSRVVAERKIQDTQRAPAPPPPPPQQQQHFAVDPSYNLYMAVECHRATAQDEDGDTPLHIALSQEEVDIHLICRLVELIQLAGKSLDIFNDMQQTPLHIAAITGNPAAARVLVEHGANPNETDRNGQTTMHNVCSNPSPGSCATLDAILRYSKVELDLDKRNYNGLAPMHLSVKNGLHGLTKLLIDHGANINCADAKSGWTPLFHAVTNQDADHVQILLGGNAQVNMQSYSGNTALHVATGRGFTEIVRLLMRYGADMSLRNTHKDTPGMITTDNNMSNILRGVASASPSLGSSGSPRYSSPSPHHAIPNGVMMLPKQSHSPQSINHRMPTPTATPSMSPSEMSSKKQGERHQRVGRREKVSRRSSTARVENAAENQATPPTTASNGASTDKSRVLQDESDETSHRVSVIVAPKSLKRRLIERTEREEQDRGSAESSPREVDIPSKKSKTELENCEGETKHPNGVTEMENLQLPQGGDRKSQSPSQLEPMDLTKPKKETDTPSLPRDSTTNSPSSSVSLSVEDDNIKDGGSPQKLLENGETSSEVGADDETSEESVVENKQGGGNGIHDDAQKMAEKTPKASLPKKERKRRRSDKLPPKKRK